MPSSMIHLLAAYKYDSKLPVKFLVGNLIPDSISEWKAKDRAHLRDKEDRYRALKELAASLDVKNDLHVGILLHLFLDYKWDRNPMKKFMDNYSGENCFEAYRHEIALASAWYYHHTQWSIQAWNEMELCPKTIYENINGYVTEDIANFIIRNKKWHQENPIGPSTVFSTEFIEEFTSEVVVEFRSCLKQYVS